jgi:hypothetical protein
MNKLATISAICVLKRGKLSLQLNGMSGCGLDACVGYEPCQDNACNISLAQLIV